MREIGQGKTNKLAVTPTYPCHTQLSDSGGIVGAAQEDGLPSCGLLGPVGQHTQVSADITVVVHEEDGFLIVTLRKEGRESAQCLGPEAPLSCRQAHNLLSVNFVGLCGHLRWQHKRNSKNGNGGTKKRKSRVDCFVIFCRVST